MRSERLVLRLAALVLIVGVLGLPINDLTRYGVLAAAILVVFTGAIATAARRWIAAAIIAAIVVTVHMMWPAPRIEEGHNAFLGPPKDAAASVVPAEVLSVLSRQFAQEYPLAARCDDKSRGCWRPDPPGTLRFAFSADGVFDHPAYSRRVTGIGFSDPAYLRLGFINDDIYGWPYDQSDIKRFERDRRSLNLFDRYRVTFPLFVMYRMPADFAGSTLCWRGTVLWEEAGGHFETMTAPDRQCRTITKSDAGRRIVAVSIKRDVRLGLTLEPSAAILFHDAVETGLALAGALAIVLVLVRITPRRLALPAILIGLALVTTLFVDAQFIGGFRPLDGGDDGIIYESFGSGILRSLLAGDIVDALRGGEAVYYFTPGLRYVRALELLGFGDTFLLYLSAMLVLPILAFALFSRFLAPRWALALVLGFAATPIGALFGSSLFQYVEWASRGFADPLAVVLLIAAMLLIVPKTADGAAPGMARAVAAGLVFAAATFCRPNLVLAAGVMVAGGAAILMARRQPGPAAALVAGFATLALSPLHNYVFGDALVLFSDNVNQPQTLLMSPLDYAKALYELLTIDPVGTHLERAVAQIVRWLSGPSEFAVMVPVHALAVAALVRVGLFGPRFDPWLRVIALATLLQHGIGASYVNFARYNLGTWLLTLMVVAAWLEGEGLALLDGAAPDLCDAWRSSTAVGSVGAALTAWADRLGLTGPGRKTAYKAAAYDKRLPERLLS
jgi:hypothetical protein